MTTARAPRQEAGVGVTTPVCLSDGHELQNTGGNPAPSTWPVSGKARRDSGLLAPSLKSGTTTRDGRSQAHGAEKNREMPGVGLPSFGIAAGLSLPAKMHISLYSNQWSCPGAGILPSQALRNERQKVNAAVHGSIPNLNVCTAQTLSCH